VRRHGTVDPFRELDIDRDTEALAVSWGLTQDWMPAAREAGIWWILSGNEAWTIRHATDECMAQRYKEATGPDRDPWNGTLEAVLQLESRGLKTLAAIIRRYIAGESPSPKVSDRARQDQGPLAFLPGDLTGGLKKGAGFR